MERNNLIFSSRPFLALIFLFFFLPLSSGCGLYFHNPEKATLAKNTFDEFKKVQTSSATIYVSMLQNLQKIEAEAAEVQAKTAQIKEETFTNQVNTITWKKILADLEVAKRTQEKWNKDIEGAVKKLLEKMGEANATVVDAKTGLEKADNLLKIAVKAENQWKARQALFQSSIIFLGNVAASEDKKMNVATLEKGKKEILDQEIEKKTMTKDGTLKTEPSTVGKVLSEDIAGTDQLPFGELLQQYTISNLNPNKAPGLTVGILSLAMDLAQAQGDKAKLRVNYLWGRITSMKAQVVKLDNIRIAIQIINDRINHGDFVRSDTVLVTVNKLKKLTGKEIAINDAFEALIYYALTKTLDESAMLELQTKPAVFDHQYSIQLSAINAREHEALISRGLQGLVIYHEDGITQELIANFLRAAQTAALAVITAGVL